MDNRIFSRDYSLLAPLLIGVISVLGICLIITPIWFPRQNAQTFPTQTVTPFKYLLLATLTPVPAVELEIAVGTEILPVPTATLEGGVALNPASTDQAGISTNDFFTSTITITPNPIFAESVPMKTGTYDDSDSHIIRTGIWKNQGNVDAYQETLLVSNTVGNSVAFSFIGRQMVLGYQSSDNAGDITINMDGSEVTFTQLVGNAWFSQEVEPGTHFVILTHMSGASVNLDYIDVPN